MSCLPALKRHKSEEQIIKEIFTSKILSKLPHKTIIAKAEESIETIRASNKFSMENFLSLYNLSNSEGVAILGLAEALLRIPDYENSNLLIYDKLSNKNWGKYLFKKGFAPKTFITSFGLYLSSKVCEVINYNNILGKHVSNFGKKAFTQLVKRAVLYLSREFIFAEDIELALKKQSANPGSLYSFDLLGESARTQYHADIYYKQYEDAIYYIGKNLSAAKGKTSQRPSLSVKLTALHPRFEYTKLEILCADFLDKVVALLQKAAKHNIAITFDAEESYRTEAYLAFIAQLINHPELKNFEGMGVVIQAYQTTSLQIIDQIYQLAKDAQKTIFVRLVKGAYWDAEIKRAQEFGLKYYPVFTKKEYTDLNYIACAKKLFGYSDYLYPQIATHNALTVETIISLAKDKEFEFQKLYGMGDILHANLRSKNYNTRIYAPIGTTKDLLAYLMRRMLENGASANFVNKVSDKNIALDQLAYNINDHVLSSLNKENKIILPENIYKNRKNAMGYELGYKSDYTYIKEKIDSYFDKVHVVGPIIDGYESIKERHSKELFRPAKYAEKFCSVSNATEGEITEAITASHKFFDKWNKLDIKKRAQILNNIADQYEKNKFELYSILIKEAGKSISDAINEVIEAIDFCRYYALQATKLMHQKQLPGPTGEDNVLSMHGKGVFVCISPWNFPLAIFTGQIVAALVTGNTVIAKPADQTPVIANYAVKLMHKAGVPKSALHLIFASGLEVSKYAVSNPNISGVVFTGSCATAKAIHRTLAQEHEAILPLIAETGGQNAMIVDSSALLEQITDDVLFSAFYSAGQRCSALRILYIQEEIYDELLSMIEKAMSLIKLGDTADFSNDIGPVIDKISQDKLLSHINNMVEKGFKVTAHPQTNLLNDGHYFYPHIIEVNSIKDIDSEKFGPILHVVKYKSKELDKVIEEINNCGYGLTFGLHSRIEERINYIKSKIKVGNIYANRSMIGAKVETQPFGGENLSGTGFKAGGPHYLLKFISERTITVNNTAFGGNVDLLNM